VVKVQCMFGCGLDHRRRGLGENLHRRGQRDPDRGPLYPPPPPHWHKPSVLCRSPGSLRVAPVVSRSYSQGSRALAIRPLALFLLFPALVLCVVFQWEMTSKKKTTQTTASSAASNAPITSKDASKLLSSTTAQHLLEDTADDVQIADERNVRLQSPRAKRRNCSHRQLRRKLPRRKKLLQANGNVHKMRS
jgi:hypothetical protein